MNRQAKGLKQAQIKYYAWNTEVATKLWVKLPLSLSRNEV